jgi:hypothetical protein
MNIKVDQQSHVKLKTLNDSLEFTISLKEQQFTMNTASVEFTKCSFKA